MRNNYLYDAALLRPLAIVLLVLYHAFIPYTHGWAQPKNFQDIDSYWWIAKASYSCMLELFVFISGCVFALSFEKKKPTLKQVVVSKLKRLYLPSIVFSVTYLFLFVDYTKDSLSIILYKILSGIGHMWFLPMLFWCTLLAYLIDKIKIGTFYKIIILFCLTFASFFPLPLRMGNAFFYLLYFYIGMVFFRYKKEIISKCTFKNIVVAWGLYLTIFIFGTILIKDYLPQLQDNTSIISKLITIELSNLIHIIYSMLGVIAIYSLTNWLLITKQMKVSKIILNLNAYCFGIYLFQQFILIALYYYTETPSLIGPYVLPWVGFIMALSVSILLSYYFRLTKIGKALI